MSKQIHVTMHGVRRLIPKLAQTVEKKDGLRVSQKVMLHTADKHNIVLVLCETKHVSSKTYWRLAIDFAQLRYDEQDEACKRDADFCDAFSVCMGGEIGESDLCLPWMTTELKCLTQDRDLVPAICKFLKKVVSAELCACGKQIVAEDDEMCFRCMLGLEDTDSSNEQQQNLLCPICSRFMSKQSPITSCCKKMSHEPCLLRCFARCPFCRTEPFTLIT